MAFLAASRRPRSLLPLLRRRHLPFSSSPSSAPPPSHPSSGLPALDPAILRLARARRFSEIESLLAKKSTAASSSEPHLASLILHYSAAGMTDHAIRAFETSTARRSALSFNALLSACNRSRRHSRLVPSLFTDLAAKHSVAPDKVSYCILIKSHCLSGAGATKALPILQEMKSKNIEITTVTYTTLLDSLYKEKKPEAAEKLWQEMSQSQSCSPDLPAYNVRAMHIAKNGKRDDLLALMGEMESLKLGPDTITYNYLISCHCKHGRTKDAIKVYKGMKEKGCTPNAATIKILVVALCKREDIDSAVKIFNDGVRQDKIPDLGTVKRLARGLVKVKKEKPAKAVVLLLKNKYPEEFIGDWKQLEGLVGLEADAKTAKGASKKKEDGAIAA